MAQAPTYDTLPTPKRRASRGGPELRETSVRLEVVTPILGGSPETRAIDDVDVIRAPSVRGHLRFWWRALYAAQYANSDALYQRESALWGRAATDDGGRSVVQIRVGVERAGGTDNSDIDLRRTPGAYALWPARAEKQHGQVVKPPAPRREPGTKFQITLKIAGTEKDEVEVRNALRAWILFGGYGGRTRRGLGSLKVLPKPESKTKEEVQADLRKWVPTDATHAALTDLFGLDIFAPPTRTPCDVPWVGGAAIHMGQVDSDAQRAWTTALDWLKEFRQGTTGQQGSRAREPRTGMVQPQRPSISNWPEADKVRHFSRPKSGQWTHAPRHNATAAWPRAGFGLPIIGQFQTRGRSDNERYNEPGTFELRWRAGNVEHDRLASPLIVKALPLADGTFAPCALWLNRAYPANGEVILRNVSNSQAPFDCLVANGDTARFSALAGKASLRQAFLDWLHATYQTTVVAP